jgi:hypothetical protein
VVPSADVRLEALKLLVVVKPTDETAAGFDTKFVADANAAVAFESVTGALE